MCPLSSSTEEQKQSTDRKPIHHLHWPMLAKCCGISACYDCFKEYISTKLTLNTDEDFKYSCPFCGKEWPDLDSVLVLNRNLHYFWKEELE
jgi:hypothetical protein